MPKWPRRWAVEVGGDCELGAPGLDIGKVEDLLLLLLHQGQQRKGTSFK